MFTQKRCYGSKRKVTVPQGERRSAECPLCGRRVKVDGYDNLYSHAEPLT